MNRRTLLRRWLFLGAALVWLLAIVALASQTADRSAALSGSVTARLSAILALVPGVTAGNAETFVRKMAHMCLFAGEGFLLHMAVMTVSRSRRAFLCSAGFCAALAVLNEMQQLFAAGRSCELRDMAIDTLGALIGIFAAVALDALRNKNNRTKR